MTSRERFLRALSHREADRIPIADAPWETTIARWRREGLPKDKSPFDYFGYERIAQGADLSFQLPKLTLEETETYKIVKDGFGATTRVFKGQESVPELLDYTITTRRKWEEHKPRMAWNDSRVSWDGGLKANRSFREKGLFMTFQVGCFGYDVIQRFAGAPRILEAMLDDSAWVKDMMDTFANLVITAADEMMRRGFQFDGAFLANDMGYKNGLFFSPAVYRQLEFPSQKRMCDFFHSKGMPVILHTDGDVRRLIPMLIEAGFDCLQPLEVKAGMDLVDLKKRYGDKLAFMGGIDVRAMADPDPAVIEKEIATKIPVAKKGGGYIYHADHSVPDNVSFQQYCRVIELVKRYGSYHERQ
jgi:uroporphyrinogen decarboxylase